MLSLNGMYNYKLETYCVCKPIICESKSKTDRSKVIWYKGKICLVNEDDNFPLK